MKTTKAVKENLDIIKGAEDITTADHDISKVALGIGAVMALLVGLWGVTCFVGGLASAGGLGELFKGWMSAVTGG